MTIIGSRGSVFDMAPMLWAERYVVRIAVGATDFSLLKNIQISSGAYLPSYAVGNGVLSPRKSGRSVKLSTRLRVLPRLRMSGVITLLPLYAFMAWTGKTLRLPLAAIPQKWDLFKVSRFLTRIKKKTIRMLENPFITCADQVPVQMKTETNKLQNNYSMRSAFTERYTRHFHGACLKNLMP